MTLVYDIIRDGYRESNVISIYEEPTAEQQAEGLKIVQRLFASVLGVEEGEQLMDVGIGNLGVSPPYNNFWLPAADWAVPINSRLLFNLEAEMSILLHPAPMDGSRVGFLDVSGNLSTCPVTVTGNGRLIGGATTLVLDEDSINVEYIYRSDLGGWQLISPLGAFDTWPFPTDFDDFFISGVALRVNPRSGAETSAETAEAYRQGRSRFRSRYRQSRQMESELALIRTPGTAYQLYDILPPSYLFAIGRPYFFPYY